MMTIEKGSVVRSIAGHDADRFYVVLEMEGDFAFIADGKEPKLEKPNRKRKKHLRGTNPRLDVDTLTTDKKLREALHPFNYGKLPSEGGI